MIEHLPPLPFPYFRGIPRLSIHRSFLSKDAATGKFTVVHYQD